MHGRNLVAIRLRISLITNKECIQTSPKFGKPRITRSACRSGSGRPRENAIPMLVTHNRYPSTKATKSFPQLRVLKYIRNENVIRFGVFGD